MIPGENTLGRYPGEVPGGGARGRYLWGAIGEAPGGAPGGAPGAGVSL